MNKRINILAGGVIAILLIFCTGAKPQDGSVYVNTEKVRLLDVPDGSKMGIIYKSTEMKVMEEKDNWIKVQITGWIQKPVAPHATQGTELKEKTRGLIQIITGKPER